MRRIACLLLITLGCNSAPPGVSGFGQGPDGMAAPDGSGSEGGGSSAAGSSTGTTTTTAGSTGSGVDSSTGGSSGVPPDLGPPGPTGCLGKIDFLFVISNSGSMYTDQKQLIAAIPEFYASITNHFADYDLHIMVSDTYDIWNTGGCEFCVDDCDPAGVPPTCGAQLDPCDSTLGAGVTFPAGKDSSGRRCELAGGRRYITREEPDPLAAFQCIAQVGTAGYGYAAQSMVEAISPELNGPGGCNEGFLRDDALLVVTLIHDMYDEDSKGFAEYWRDRLMEAKHGDEDAFMVLVLTTDCDQWMSLCNPNKPPACGANHRLRELAEAVPHGRIESICVESYAPFFEASAAEIVELCDGFIPQ